MRRGCGPTSRSKAGSRWSPRSTRPAGGSSRNCGTWGGWSIPTLAAGSRSRRRRSPRRTARSPMTGSKDYVEPRAVTADDIERVIGDYASAARNAIARRVRRGPDPRRQWLSGRPIPARQRPICATMIMAGRSPTGCASCARWSRRSRPRSASSAPASACRPIGEVAGRRRQRQCRALFVAAAAELEAAWRAVDRACASRGRSRPSAPTDDAAGQPGDAQGLFGQDRPQQRL